MSDVDLLAPEPVTFTPPGQEKPWTFAPCDLECELRFQSEHQRWARNQIEAMKAGVSPATYAEDVDRFVSHVSGNRFAFGGPLSLAFLLTDQGATIYLSLLAAKAGCRAASEANLSALRRKDRAAWDRALADVLRRDFPNLMAPRAGADSSSPEAETPSPSTTGSSSSSREDPG